MFNYVSVRTESRVHECARRSFKNTGEDVRKNRRICSNTYMFVQRVESYRPTQWMIYIPLLVNRFQESILLIVQYKYLKSCSKNFIPQNLILRTRSCGTAYITQLSWLGFVSGGNYLYQRWYHSQEASRWGQPLNIFIWFIRSGGSRDMIVSTDSLRRKHTGEYVLICICSYRE